MGITLSLRPSVSISHERNCSLTDERILIKRYTVVVYDLRMCMKEEDLDTNYFKGDVK